MRQLRAKNRKNRIQNTTRKNWTTHCQAANVLSFPEACEALYSLGIFNCHPLRIHDIPASILSGAVPKCQCTLGPSPIASPSRSLRSSPARTGTFRVRHEASRPACRSWRPGWHHRSSLIRSLLWHDVHHPRSAPARLKQTACCRTCLPWHCCSSSSAVRLPSTP